MGIKNSAKACTTKSVIACNTKKELTLVSTIAQKRLVNSGFICIDLNIIQTSPSCLRDLKSLDKKPQLRLVFLISVFKLKQIKCHIFKYSHILSIISWHT